MKPKSDLMNNINLHPISYRFSVIAHYWSNYRFERGAYI